MTDSGESENPAGQEDKRSQPKRDYSKIFKIVWSRFWGGVRWFADGLNYISPALTGLATAGIVWVAYWQLDTMHNTDMAIRKQLTVMENEQRPWIRPKLVGFTDMTITDDKLNFAVNIQFENVGKSPAFNVRGYQRLFNGDGNLLPQHDGVCREMEASAAAWKNPVIIFPNEATPNVLNTLEGNLKEMQLGLSPNQPENTPRVLSPEILGCVAYKSATGTTYHHTWYSWSIVRQDHAGNIRRIEAIPQNVPGREIVRVGFLSAGRNYAD